MRIAWRIVNVLDLEAKIKRKSEVGSGKSEGGTRTMVLSAPCPDALIWILSSGSGHSALGAESSGGGRRKVEVGRGKWDPRHVALTTSSGVGKLVSVAF